MNSLDPGFDMKDGYLLALAFMFKVSENFNSLYRSISNDGINMLDKVPFQCHVFMDIHNNPAGQITMGF